MATRKDEKDARRSQRQAQEQEEAQKRARNKRVGILFGVGAVVVGLIVVAILVIPGLSGDDSGSGGNSKTTIQAVDIPAEKITDLAIAAKKAGCTVNRYKNLGRDHTTKAVTFETNPPTSGDHYPEPADDGAYTPSNTPEAALLVHSLEHGRVIIQYRPGLPKNELGQLKSAFDEDNAYHMILAENQTKMPYDVAVTAWTKSLTCKKFNQNVFDAIRTFRDKYLDKGPEFLP